MSEKTKLGRYPNVEPKPKVEKESNKYFFQKYLDVYFLVTCREEGMYCNYKYPKNFAKKSYENAVNYIKARDLKRYQWEGKNNLIRKMMGLNK